MLWKLIFYAHLAGLLELGTYSDLSECQIWATKLNEQRVWTSEFRSFDLRGDTNMSYRCMPAPDLG